MTPPVQPVPFDQLPADQQRRITANIQAAQKAGRSDAEIEDYLTNGEHVGPPTLGHASTYHDQYAAGTLAPRMASENAQDAGTTPSITTEALGGAADLARDVPGAEVVQALAASGASRIPGLRPSSGPLRYRDALGALHDTEDQSGALGSVARLAGGGLSQAVLPGSATTRGAIYGALHGYTDADPEADRRAETIGQGIAGGALGFGAELAGAAGGRVLSAIKNQVSKERAVAQGIGKFASRLRPAASPAAASAPSPFSALSSFDVLPAAEEAPVSPIAQWSGPNIWDSFGDHPPAAPVQADLIAGLRDFAARKGLPSVVP